MSSWAGSSAQYTGTFILGKSTKWYSDYHLIATTFTFPLTLFLRLSLGDFFNFPSSDRTGF
jgi:hypothetical protein